MQETFPRAATNGIYHDPGHYITNVRNSIKKVIGEGVEFKGFAKRVSQWVMTCIKRAEEYADGKAAYATHRSSCHPECHERQCWFNPPSSSSSPLSTSPPQSSNSSSSSSSSSVPSPTTLAGYMTLAPGATPLPLLELVPSQSIRSLFNIPAPASPRYALMYTRFLSLMNYFFTHYTTQPCCRACPCRERLEKRPVNPATATTPTTPAVPPAAAASGAESKDEKREAEPDPESETHLNLALPFAQLNATHAVIDEFELDKSSSKKFYFDWTKPHHRTKLLSLIPIFEDIMKHMNVILHGFHTCVVEQFARERSAPAFSRLRCCRRLRLGFWCLMSRTKLTPKAVSYNTSWHARCLATALSFHHRSGTIIHVERLPLVHSWTSQTILCCIEWQSMIVDDLLGGTGWQTNFVEHQIEQLGNERQRRREKRTTAEQRSKRARAERSKDTKNKRPQTGLHSLRAFHLSSCWQTESHVPLIVREYEPVRTLEAGVKKEACDGNSKPPRRTKCEIEQLWQEGKRNGLYQCKHCHSIATAPHNDAHYRTTKCKKKQ